MVVLRHAALLVFGLLLGLPVLICAQDDPLLDFQYDGYVQGRFTGFLFNRNVPDGPLNTFGRPAYAGGITSTRPSFKNVDFSLKTKLPMLRWSLAATAGVKGSKAIIKDLYVKYEQNAVTTWRLGKFRVPFGIEPQTSSRSLDTIERSLLYGFGNFGWVEPLGLEMIGERDVGLRVDFQWPAWMAGFAPYANVALVMGNGRQALPDLPTQGMLRLGLSNRLAIDELRQETALGASFSYGQNKFEERTEQYIPIGSQGDLLTNPSAALQTTNLGGRRTVATLGLDGKIRTNNLVLKAEWVRREVESTLSQGYSLTGIYELDQIVLEGLEFVARWEQVVQGYTNGAHYERKPYQAAVVGGNWRFGEQWKLQVNYITLFLELKPHQFPGSDLFITQLQFEF